MEPGEIIKDLMEWSEYISGLFNKIEPITVFSICREEKVIFYCAQAEVDGVPYNVRRIVDTDDLDDLQERFGCGMIKVILHLWAKDKNIDLNPPKASG